MLFTIIAFIIVVALTWKIDQLQDIAKAKGKEEPSYANPFTWIKALIALLGVLVGYTPWAVKDGIATAKALKEESKLEFKRAELEGDVTFKSQKAIGNKVGKQVHYDRIQKANKDREAAIDALAILNQ